MGEVLTALLLVTLLFGGALYAINQNVKNRVIAKAPPSAQINPDDDVRTALAKSKNHHRVIEAVRIFNELQHQDRQLAIFDDKTKRDVQTFLDDYYKDN